MSAWFSRAPKPSVEQMLSELAACGIQARDEAALAAMRERTEFDITRGYEMLLVAMGVEPFDQQTYEPLEPYSNDVWYFDYEAIEDHGAYKSIVENCLRLSGGALSYDEVADYVDVDAGIAWVELRSKDQPDRMDLRVDSDWADPQIFQELNNRLQSTGSGRRYAQHGLGQDCLLICKTPDEIAAINRITRLQFRSRFG